MEEAPAATRAHLAWTGAGSSFDVRTEKAQIRLESGPGRTAISPMEAMLAALSGCMAVDVVEILTKMRQPPTSYSVECEGWRADSPPRRFTSIRLTHRVRGTGLAEASVRRAVALSQEKYCSAMSSLDPGIAVDNQIVLSNQSSGTEEASA